MKSPLGFNLLELAIVLVVLGLLIGAILEWQEHIEAQNPHRPATASPRST